MKKTGEVILKYLSEFPNLASRTLAKKIYNENNLIFTSDEHARSLIRMYKGKNGNRNLNKLKNTKFLSEDKMQEKYNLPPSIQTNYEPFKIIANKVLIFADVHIPFHNIEAIETMFNYTINKNIDAIIINGDFTDCFQISHFAKEPNIAMINDERNQAKDFLKELKRIYPNAKIYYKFGNHEKRFHDYLKIKAPELFGFSEFRWEVLLDLFNLGVEYIPEEKYIVLNDGLKILHGHEYKNGITSPANAARTTFLRTKSTALSAHNHQTSHHPEQNISGEILSCWSIGCLCGLNPEYMPLNKWNHGFAIYELHDDNFWHIENKMIIKGKVV